MPSASVKPPESCGSIDQLDPVNKLLQVMEKKIRNLEKRKNKLEHYKEELRNGKELNEDQQNAVDAFDSVLVSLDLCREFSTHIVDVIVENTKLQKVQLKKQQEERLLHDCERIRQILKVQDILHHMSNEEVKNDFIEGANGALRVPKEKLDNLEALNELIMPSRDIEEKCNSPTFKEKLGVCAENFLALLDGRNKAAGKSTYKDMRSLIYRISNCPYPNSMVSKTPTPDIDETSSQKLRNNEDNIKEIVKEVSELDKIESSANAKTPIENTEETQTTRDSSVSSSCSTNLPINKTTRDPTFNDGPPPGISAPMVSPINPPTSVSELRNSLVQMSPTLPSAPPTQITSSLQNQSYISQSSVQNEHVQPSLSPFALDINDLVRTSRFNFFQESQVGQGTQEQSSVYMDPAVVSFGSIKPESLIHLHEQQQSQQQKLAHSQGLHQHVGLSTPTAFMSPSISESSTTHFTTQSVSLYTQSSPIESVSPLTQKSQVQSSPERLQETTSWADQVTSHLASTTGASTNATDDTWGDTLNGEDPPSQSSVAPPADAVNITWSDPSDDKTLIDQERKNTFRGPSRGSRGMRGNGMNSGFRGGRGNNFMRSSNNGGGGSSYGNGGNNFRNGRPASSSLNAGGNVFRGGRGSNSIPRGNSNNRGLYRGNRGGANYFNRDARGQF